MKFFKRIWNWLLCMINGHDWSIYIDENLGTTKTCVYCGKTEPTGKDD